MNQAAVLGDRYRLGERIADGGRLPWPEAFALGEQVARALDAALIRRALAKDPSARFPSATAMADALAAVRDEVAGAPDPGHAAPARPAARAPGREGNPMPDAWRGDVHSPPPAPVDHSPHRRRGWRWRRSS
jgi:hypothetical protein